MSEFNELYQQIILDHSRKPRNHRIISDTDHQAAGHNPLCGDKIDVYLTVRDGIVEDASFQGSGCAISQSSASLMTELVKGKRLEEVEELSTQFHDIITGRLDPDMAEMGKLSVFSGVRNYPSRVKCAALAWHTLKNALDKSSDVSSTEE